MGLYSALNAPRPCIAPGAFLSACRSHGIRHAVVLKKDGSLFVPHAMHGYDMRSAVLQESSGSFWDGLLDGTPRTFSAKEPGFALRQFFSDALNARLEDVQCTAVADGGIVIATRLTGEAALPGTDTGIPERLASCTHGATRMVTIGQLARSKAALLTLRVTHPAPPNARPERARTQMRMAFCDAVFCATGGTGCIATLEHDEENGTCTWHAQVLLAPATDGTQYRRCVERLMECLSGGTTERSTVLRDGHDKTTERLVVLPETEANTTEQSVVQPETEATTTERLVGADGFATEWSVARNAADILLRGNQWA